MSNTSVILVTGSTTGFGRLTVETLARQGHRVFAAMRESTGKNARAFKELQTLAEKTRLALQVVDLDVTDDASVRQAIEYVVRTANRLDVIVNNAGVSYTGPIEAFTLEQVQQQFDTNVFGVIRVNRAALPQMRAQASGLLLQVGSVLGRVALPFAGLYGASKFALEGLTEAYRYELAALGIDAVIVEPTTYPTHLVANSHEPVDKERIAPYAAVMNALAPRSGAPILNAAPPDPQEVANAIAALIALPAGVRPLRTIVTPNAQQRQPLEGINETTRRVTSAFLESLGALPHVTLVPDK
jgi:NAD(P)-dependent dehydrogenase (short-subunit alcohol dehydrogenase family)